MLACAIPLFCLIAAAAAPAQEKRPIPERGKPLLQAPAVDAMMRQFMHEHEVHGASIAICKDGQLVYARAFGWADALQKEAMRPQSLLRIASISKPITAVAVLRLVEEGRLSLHDNPFELLGLGDQLGKKLRDPRLADITLEHLLQHRAGWDRGQSFDPMFIPGRVRKFFQLDSHPTPNQLLRYMLLQPLDFEPGSRYAYSNYGYFLLGRVIEKVTGTSYRQAVQDLVLTPLGITSMRLGKSLPQQRWPSEVQYIDPKGRMRSAVVKPGERVPIGYSHDQEILDANGGWIATAEDLARFAAAFRDPQRSPLLSEESIAQMWAKPATGKDPVWYGCGWSVRQLSKQRRNVWHSGLLTGGTSTIMVLRHDGYSWAVLFNSDRSRKNNQVLAGLIDGLVHRAVDRVDTWPAIGEY